MPHDGQTVPTTLLPDLLALTRAAIAPAEAVLGKATEALRSRVAPAGKVDATLLEADQHAAHGLAWLATYVESLRQMQAWADALHTEGRFGEMEALIHQIAFGEYLQQIAGGIPMNQGEIVRMADMGLDWTDLSEFQTDAVRSLRESGNTDAARLRLVALMRENHGRATFGATGLDEELEMIRDQFRRYADEQIVPHPRA